MGTSSSLRLFFPGGTKGENRGERNPPPLAASIADAIAPQTLDGVGREELFGLAWLTGRRVRVPRFEPTLKRCAG